MIETLTDEQKAVFFTSAPAADEVWLGDIFHIENRFEVIPFQFRHQYLAVFYHPEVTIGDLEYNTEVLAGWANGFVPAYDARLVKFARSDAVNDFYSPEIWQLDNPRQIFQFGELLGDVVLAHVSTQACSQYLYWPADRRLSALYRRIARRLACPSLGYNPILNGTAGEFHGYLRP